MTRPIRYDVPVLLFLGGWVLVSSWDIGGLVGLVFPGLIGWILWIVALLRGVTGSLGGAGLGSDDRRIMRRIWLGSALAFVVLAAAELFMSRLMPASWRAFATHALHIRRVYRQYGP